MNQLKALFPTALTRGKADNASKTKRRNVGGCESICDFAFLQTSLNLKNPAEVETAYELDEQVLGSGTFGVVYLGVHIATKQRRAIKKIIKNKTSEKEQEELKTEMDILQQLSHPNILQLIEYFETTSDLFVVTDVYEGGELFDEIISRKRFDEDDARPVIVQLLSCVAYLTEKKIVHRDMKPENIMLEKSKDLTAIKLIDFGHAVSYNPKRDKLMTEKVGTPYYMAPEVLARKYDNKCDIWSLGVISYILPCGTPPFNGKSNAEIFEKIKKAQVSFSQSAWKNVSAEARDFVSLCLDRNFKHRSEAKSLLDHEFIRGDSFGVTKRPHLGPKKKTARKPRKGPKSKINHLSSRASTTDETYSRGATGSTSPRTSRGRTSSLSKVAAFVGLSRSSRSLEDTNGLSEAIRNLKQFRCKDKLAQIVYTYVIAQCLPKEKRDELAKIFQAWDKDNDGFLSRKEIQDALKKHVSRFSNFSLDNLFDQIDQDGSGAIEYNEFLLAATDPTVLMSRENVTAVFNLFDKDGNGFLSMEELRAVVNDQDVLDETIQEMLDEADVDGDGQLSREEFVRLLAY